jgi:hypothetical protein
MPSYPIPPNDNDYDDEPLDDLTGLQICIIIILIFACTIAAITLHPAWFGA